METNQFISIKNWALEDRPREKLLLKGTNNLSDAELISILLGSGTQKMSAVELSRQLLSIANNNLHQLGKISIAELKKIKGIGEAKAIKIIAAMELGKRRKISEIIEKKQINGSHDVYEIFHSVLSDISYEEFWVMLLNRSNKLIEKIKISQGGVSGTVIDTRIILKLAIERLASSIVLCHNHPSGNINPSNSDIEITQKVKNASSFFDIALLDHIIVSDNGYYSFADEGAL